ncbi:hypothetical protein [Streptomyces sp. NPDC048473]|uniref:hypothetical protein n=1 Tax=unclassified Streptomyces TaxID=2593676 RepID=UPI0037140C30
MPTLSRVVDYLQLAEVEQNRNITREQAVAAVSRGAAALALSFGTHYIADRCGARARR